MEYSTFLNKALNSFEGFRGAKMPTNPTTEQEYLLLRNAVDGGSIWQDENNSPTWQQVKDKIDELQNAYETEQEAKEANKASALAKLSALGLTEEEVNSIL
jgi:hypothetical protein